MSYSRRTRWPKSRILSQRQERAADLFAFMRGELNNDETHAFIGLDHLKKQSPGELPEALGAAVVGCSPPTDDRRPEDTPPSEKVTLK